MAEIGEIYKFDSSMGQGNIYARVIERINTATVNILCIKPTKWKNPQYWETGKIKEMRDGVLQDWVCVMATTCIKCSRKNPCHKLEVLCPGCRL